MSGAGVLPEGMARMQALQWHRRDTAGVSPKEAFMTRAKTPSDRARALRAKHPTWSLSRIAAACGISKQGVAKAIAATKPRGRPKGKSAKGA